MPRDTGAPDAPLSPFAHRLEVLKRYRRRANGEKRKARKMTAAYIQTVDLILRDIIHGADFLAEGTIQVGEREWNREKAVFLLVSLSPRHFVDLCVIGAELEDDEEECEDEGAQCEGEGESDGQDDEPSLGSQDAVMDQTQWGQQSDTWPWPTTDGEPNGDEEPSLGSCDGIINQERWHSGHVGDEELDRADDEPDADNEPDERDWPVHTYPGDAP